MRDEGLTDLGSPGLLATVLPRIADLSCSLLCLSLGKNSISDLGATSLSSVVSQCQFLQLIDLSDNHIGPSGMTALSIIFSTCTRLSEVILSRNPFGDDGGLALAVSLKHRSTASLETLLISGCQLTTSSIREITAAICADSQMASLDVSRNNIDAFGAECIFQCFQTHQCIRSIDLSHNCIGDSGIVAAAQCLAQFNTSVRRVGLENNNVNISGVVKFISLLHSRGLDYVSLLGKSDPQCSLQSVFGSEEWLLTGLPTPPQEVNDLVRVLAYIRASLVSGRQTLRRMRFMLIGNGLAGKTRLAGALMNTQENSHPDIQISNRTIGIDCSPLQLDSPDGAIDIEVWDFAGQEVSYLSHTQYFSARRCLYLLVWSPFPPPPMGDFISASASAFASLDQITRPLLSWIETLFLHVPNAKFILCGTHAAVAKELSEDAYCLLCNAVQACVEQKLDQLCALASAELRELTKLQQRIQIQLHDSALKMPSNPTLLLTPDDVYQWSTLSEDNRLDRKFRLIAEAAVKDAWRMTSVRDRIALIQDKSSSPPCHNKLQLLDVVYVDSSDGSGIANLRALLVWNCEEMPALSEEIPKAWVVCESLFSSMHEKLGNVITRDDAVNFVTSIMPDLRNPWEAIEFWGYLGRVFICETGSGSTRQCWIVPDMMFLLDLIRPLIHWDPTRMLVTNSEFFVLSARELHSDNRRATESLLADMKRDSVVRRRLLNYFAKWGSLTPDQQNAMLEFFHKCHLVCTVDESSTPFSLPFDLQADRFLVTARVHNVVTHHAAVIVSPSDINTYHAYFCLPLLHISFLMRLQSRLLARKTSIDLRFQLHQDCVFVRRNSSQASKFYCCIQSLPSSDFESIQRQFSQESILREEFQHSIYVHSDDLGLFQFATQTIEETLATLFSGLRYMCHILTERDRINGCGHWLELGIGDVPNFSVLWSLNWFEEFDSGKSLHYLFPHKRCPIMISHSWSDGTEEFVNQLRLQLQHESLAAVCLDSAFFPQTASCAIQNAFRRGLCEASVIIVCLTPRYLTRPNCLKEFQWALDLSEKKCMSVIFLPLHPACTFDGITSLLKQGAVYVSAKDDGDCCLLPLNELALELLKRYIREHIGDQKKFKFRWPEMKAWLSDSSDDVWNEAGLRDAAKHLVSQPVLRDFLAVECNADMNESFCKDINDKLIDTAPIFKKDLTETHISSYSPEIYPEDSYVRFFFFFDCRIRIHQVNAIPFLRWRDLQCFVRPTYTESAVGITKNMQLHATCQFDGKDSDLKLQATDFRLSEDPKCGFQIFVSAILLQAGIQIDIIEFEDAFKRALWMQLLKFLPVHAPKDSLLPTVSPKSNEGGLAVNPGACTLYISACRRAQSSAGRNMRLHLSAIMDSLNRVIDPGIAWRFGNFMTADLSKIASVQSKFRVFLSTGDEFTLNDATSSCNCEECVDVFRKSRKPLATQFVALQSSSVQKLQPLLVNPIASVSFAGKIVSECNFSEEYLKTSIIDAQILRLFDEIKGIHDIQQLPPHLKDCAGQFVCESYEYVKEHFQRYDSAKSSNREPSCFCRPGWEILHVEMNPCLLGRGNSFIRFMRARLSAIKSPLE
jgi:hypothetical protein